jgi:DNA-binding transcriptional MerR regulator
MENRPGLGGSRYSRKYREKRAKARREQQKRTGYVRPSRAKPKTGWTLGDLAAITGMKKGVLKRWLERGIVPRPPFRGVATRYERQQLVWVLAVRRLQAKDQVPLPKIKERLTAMSASRSRHSRGKGVLPVRRPKRSGSRRPMRRAA